MRVFVFLFGSLLYVAIAELLVSDKFQYEVNGLVRDVVELKIPPSMQRGVIWFQPVVEVHVEYRMRNRELSCFFRYPWQPLKETDQERFDVSQWINSHPRGSVVKIRVHKIFSEVCAYDSSIDASVRLLVYLPYCLFVFAWLFWIWMRGWIDHWKRRKRKNMNLPSR